MEKRLIIAVLLSIGVLYAYSFVFPPPKVEQPVSSALQKGAPSAQVNPSAFKVGDSVVANQQAGVNTPGVSASAREITVDTDLFTATFSSQGAALKKLVLKKYKESLGPLGKDIVLVDEGEPGRFALLSDSREFGISPSTVFNSSANSLKLPPSGKGTLEFSTLTPQGVLFKKSYHFYGDSYRISLSEELQNTGSTRVEGVLHLLENDRVHEVHKGEGRFEVYGPSTLADNKVSNDKLDHLLKGPVQYDKVVIWSAFGDKYFVDAIISENGSIASLMLARSGSDSLLRDLSSPAISLPPGVGASLSYSLYYGPKDLDILKAQGNRLEEVINYGWFAPISKPLIYALKFLYSYTHNYGFAIIIITCILKLLFFPLTNKSYKSMKEMQKLQPKMAELKEKFKNDRDTMNKAVMELYKTHKVNPMGGCLPMLVQIPVFFGLYRALMFSIELRQAPFMLWITDLSAKDPYYVTPVIMGATMFIQQKMTPSNMDPVQAKMMLALPVVFTFMFLNFPAGLVVYWLVNNVLTIAQQMYINKSVKA
jgi:YidC/Oxa1 family membrane protein insertase